MIGQKSLLEKINSIEYKDFPRTLMIEGSIGSGRHTIVKYIGNKLNLPINDITDNLSLELLNSITVNPEPFLYLINGDNITAGNKSLKEENIILKFLEEPLKNAFIIVITENSNSLLQTVINRCVLWRMEPYSIDELKEFSQDDELLKIANTPGKLLSYTGFPIKEIKVYIQKVFEGASKVTLPSILNVENKISFKKTDVDRGDSNIISGWEEGKYPWMIFADIALYCARKYYEIYPEEKWIDTYFLTQRLCNELKNHFFDKDYLFSNYLCNLWKIHNRGESFENCRP